MRTLHGTVPLFTRRLSLRLFSMEDVPDIYATWASDPQVTRFLRWSTHQDEAETRTLVRGWCYAYDEEPDFYNWAVTEQATGRLLGSIGLTGAEPYPLVGYALGRAYWGQGYATEALQAVCSYLTDSEGFACLAAIHAKANIASGRVLEKAGFVYDRDEICKSFDRTRRFDCRVLLLRAQQP